MASNANSRPFDVVIFGASGFTGQYVVEELAKVCKEETPVISWAVAGRNEKKVLNVLKNAAKYTGLDDVEKTKIIIADVGDYDSLVAMAKQCKLVINCIGPYWIYGEPVVKACVANGTHHIDISGEPYFVERMELEYNQKAKDNKCYVIGACGFDSIPTETAMMYLQDKFPGELNSVEGFVKLKIGRAGMVFNTGTLLSAAKIFGDKDATIPIREKIFPEPLPKPRHPLASRGQVYYNQDTSSWCGPLPSTDMDVAVRTQYYNYFQKKLRPVDVKMYSEGPSLIGAIAMFIAFFGFYFITLFSFTRYLLEKFPRLMTAGMFSATGGTREQIKGTSVKITYVGKGYKSKLAEPSDQHTDKPDQKMILEVRMPEAGYDATPICFVQSALIILRETNKLPGNGGVMTPGVAFRDTTIVDRLNKHNITFKIR